MQAPTQYAVRLDSFEGPLDLLLRLIEKAELDITTISLALVTDQYLAHIHQLEEMQPELLADFLVVAAKLILIKSRALLPQAPVPKDDEEEDVGRDLVRQLEEYRRYKEASLALRKREEQGLRSHVRVAPPVLAPRTITPGEVSVAELLAALQRVLVTKPAAPVSTVIAPITITLTDRIRTIEQAVAGSRRVHFTGLLMRAESRVEIIVTFLAVLELIKRGKLHAEQESAFGEIYLVQATRNESRTPPPPPPPAAPN